MPRSDIGPKGGGQDARSQTGVAGRHRGDDTTNNGEMAERFKALVLTALQEQHEQCRVAALAEGRRAGCPESNRRSPAHKKQKRTKHGEMAERFKAPVLKTGVVAIPPWVRIPLSPPDKQGAPPGAFCLSGGESGWTNPLGFDKFVWNEFGQPKGWPRSAPARRGEAQDEPNNPALLTDGITSMNPANSPAASPARARIHAGCPSPAPAPRRAHGPRSASHWGRSASPRAQARCGCRRSGHRPAAPTTRSEDAAESDPDARSGATPRSSRPRSAVRTRPRCWS
jgi:hypothetical protein